MQSAFCYGGPQLDLINLSINYCVCLAQGAGKLDFPPPLKGIAQQVYFITIHHRLMPEISVLAWRFKQTEETGRP